MTEWLDTGPQPRRRRWWWLGAVAALAVVLVGVVLLPRATPRELVGPPDQAPARPWPAGSWQRTHRVDLPDGWRVREERIEADRSSTLLLGPSGTPIDGGRTPGRAAGCTVVVGRGGGAPAAPGPGTAVRVRGVPGVYVAVDSDQPGRPAGVFWPGPDGTRASVTCSLDEPRTLALADRVTVAAGAVRVPVRLTTLPAGYAPDAIRFRDGTDVALTVRPGPAEPGAGPVPDVPVRAWSQPGPLRMTGSHEWVSVAGRPAWMRAEDRQLCLTQVPVGCVAVDRVDSSGDPRWPTEVRDLLIDVAGGLVPARDPSDPYTWFDGVQAFPAE